MAPSAYGSGIPAPLPCANVTRQGFPADVGSLTAPSTAMSGRLRAWIAGRRNTDPVAVMAHGFLYDPRPAPVSGTDNLVETVYGHPPRPRRRSTTPRPII